MPYLGCRPRVCICSQGKDISKNPTAHFMFTIRRSTHCCKLVYSVLVLDKFQFDEQLDKLEFDGGIYEYEK